MDHNIYCPTCNPNKPARDEQPRHSLLISFSGEHPEVRALARDFTSRQLQQVHAGSITTYLEDIDVTRFGQEIGSMANQLMELLGVGPESQGRERQIYDLLNEIDSRASIMESED